MFLSSKYASTFTSSTNDGHSVAIQNTSIAEYVYFYKYLLKWIQLYNGQKCIPLCMCIHERHKIGYN